MGITPWSPLGAGFLTGKYQRQADGAAAAGGGRLDSNNQPFRMFTDRNWRILDELRAVSAELEKPLSQVALAWVAIQPGITAPIFGATTMEQLNSNLAALEVTVDPAQLERLQRISAFAPGDFYELFQGPINRSIFGGAMVKSWLSAR